MARRPAASTTPTRGAQLTRERVLAAAIDLADAEGLDGLSMRRLGAALAVDPMAIYRHVRDKDDLLDGMVDSIVARVPIAAGETWDAALRSTILGARAELLRHPWAKGVIESRPTPGPATVQYIDRVLGILRGGGASVELCHHALHVLGSRLMGFSQDLYDDATGTDNDPELMALQFKRWAATVPHVAELAMAASHDGGLGGCDDDAEFRFALDLILEGLARRIG
ncbi:MAG: TetR/AcrR family transcriptional regulator C-terminal domain-containing protein [Chloroflexota bacterium]